MRPSLVPILLLAVLSPAKAVEPFTSQELAAIDRLCRTTAALPPSPLAIEVAATAVREHEAFGGHVIDRDGRFLRFGAVEAEAFRNDPAGRGVPWRQVMRYWQSLGSLEGLPLEVRRFPGLIDNPTATTAGVAVPLAGLREAAGQAGVSAEEREALLQSAIRAALVDVPWSAAFASHVALSAGVARSRFAASQAHVDYVAEAAGRSREEAAGHAATAFYRACDPRRTPMRPGDLICNHRHPPAEIDALGLSGSLFASLAGALARGERPVWNLHCDIVIGVDRPGRVATIIGGNVLQSVTRRGLRTDRRGALAPARRYPVCLDNAEPGPVCRPEAAPWFVLLQSVDAPMP